MSVVHRSGLWSAAFTLSLALAVGCGDDDDPRPDPNPLDGSVVSPDGSISTPDAGIDGAVTVNPGPTPKAVYYYQVTIFSPDGTSTAYVLLRDKLDFNITVQDLNSARPQPAYSGVAPINGQLILTDSQSPFASKWDISESLEWKQVGQPLNFTDYSPNDEDSFNFYFQTIRGADVLFFNGSERTSRLPWNVTSWSVGQNVTASALPVPPAGGKLINSGNRTGVRDWKGPALQSFYVADEATGVPAANSQIAVYDPQTAAERLLDVPCPVLAQHTLDADGNAYFSTTFAGTLLGGLYGVNPMPCLRKVKVDGTVDDSFAPNVEAFTGGNPGVNFRYLGKGKAFANVLRKDKLADVSFTLPPDPAVEQRITGRWGADDKFTPPDSSVWEQHLIDLASRSSKVITGWEDAAYNPNYMITFTVDDRVFLSAQYDPYGSARNVMYELDLDTATVKRVGGNPGDLNSFGRLR